MKQSSHFSATSPAMGHERFARRARASAMAMRQSDSALLFGLRKDLRHEDRMWLVVALSAVTLLVFSLWG